MPAPYGVTTTGFNAQTLAEVRDTVVAALRRTFGAQANVDSRSRLGQYTDILSEQLYDVWQLALAVAGALNPGSATGVVLDNLCALTGTTRKVATYSTVTLACVGTAATVLPVGRVASVAGTSARFQTTASATLAVAAAWAATTAYSVGDVRSASGALWYATVAGTSGSTAPTGAGPVTDGGMTWTRIGTGAAFALVAAQATVTGAVQGYAGSVATIETPVAGWASVVNVPDAAAGRALETDSELRARRTREIAGIGTSSLDALRAAILKTTGVTSCTVFENTTDATVDSITPHAVEALIEGGLDATVRAAIFASIAAGIETCGGVTGSISDSQGNPHTIKFSRPASVSVYVAVSVTKDASAYPIDGDAKVKAAIVAAGNARGLGIDTVAARLEADVFAAVPGILDVSCAIGTSPTPTTRVTVPISLRQRAAFDTSRIGVVSINGVP
jgi:uncharacterized phage protein gp47/JayE